MADPLKACKCGKPIASKYFQCGYCYSEDKAERAYNEGCRQGYLDCLQDAGLTTA